MNVVIILLGVISLNISMLIWIIHNDITDINENLERILRKMDEK